jgi:hypothetical protein
MLQEITTQVQFIETCPVPECNLSNKEVEQSEFIWATSVARATPCWTARCLCPLNGLMRPIPTAAKLVASRPG